MNLPPPPVLDLSYSQMFQLKALSMECQKASPEVLTEAVIAAQQSNYVLQNTISNLLRHWPIHAETDNPGTDIPEEYTDLTEGV